MKTTKFTVFPTGSICNYEAYDEEIAGVIIVDTLSGAKEAATNKLEVLIQNIKSLKYKDIPFYTSE